MLNNLSCHTGASRSSLQRCRKNKKQTTKNKKQKIFDTLNNWLSFEEVYNQCVVLRHFVSYLISQPRFHGFGPIGSHLFGGVFFQPWFHCPAWLLVHYILVDLQPSHFQAQLLVIWFLCSCRKLFVLNLLEKQTTRGISIICCFQHTQCVAL